MMSEYLGEVVLAEQLAGHAASLKLLESISHGNARLSFGKRSTGSVNL